MQKVADSRMADVRISANLEMKMEQREKGGSTVPRWPSRVVLYSIKIPFFILVDLGARLSHEGNQLSFASHVS
jgi:hypothetical protein